LKSDRKIKANRANARMSTGPKTRHGRARSAKNTFRHGALRTAASQRLVSLTLGFGKFAPGPPAGADPALIVIGLPGLVCITQGPSAHVKHP